MKVWSWEDLVAQWWQKDRDRTTPYALEPTEQVRRYLDAKAAVAVEFAPRLIGEFGVRTGYSAWAMLAACEAQGPLWGAPLYVGFDIGNPAEPGAVAHGIRILARRFPGRTVVIGVDTHALLTVPPFDLLHVDGDHTTEGCLADLELALRSGVHHVIVDDYLYMHEVKLAVDEFAVRHRLLNVTCLEDGLRGMALINLKGKP